MTPTEHTDYRSFILDGQPGDTLVKPSNPWRTSAENAKSVSIYVLLDRLDAPDALANGTARHTVRVEQITSTFAHSPDRVLTGNRVMSYRTTTNTHNMRFEVGGMISEFGGDYNNLMASAHRKPLAVTPAAASGRFNRKTLAEHHAKAVSDRLEAVRAELESTVQG